MSVKSVLKKIASNLDFWDVDENRRQNAAIDEEERRRKRQQNAAVSSVSRAPGSLSVQPTQNQPELVEAAKPLNKVVASQSDSQPLKVVTTPAQDLEKLVEQNRPQAEAESKKGTNFIERLTTDRDWKKRAEMNARTKAIGQYQQAKGYNKAPEVMDALKVNQRQGEELAASNQNLGRKLDKVENAAIKTAQVASYVPITGSVLNLSLAANEGLKKVSGDKAGADAQDEQRLRIDLGMDKESFEKLDPETRHKLRVLQGAGLAASPLDFLGLGGLAKSGLMSGGKKLVTEAIKDKAVSTTTKDLVKAEAKNAAKQAVVPAAAGAGVSVGAQAYLGGPREVDPMEALKTGALVGGTSLLFPSDGLRKAGTRAAKDVEAPVIPGIQKVTEATDTATEPTIEVGNGISSTNLAKASEHEKAAVKAADEAAQEIQVTNPHQQAAADAPIDVPTIRQNIPDPADPMALAKADSVEPLPPSLAVAPNELPMADFSKSINAPLQKVAPEELATPNLADAPIRDGATIEGNQVLKSDAQVAQELADQGIAPAVGDSPVAATEDAMAAAADQAAREQVAQLPISRLVRTEDATELDPGLVLGNRNALNDGVNLDPVKITIGSDGRPFVEDGKHRVAAYEAEGRDNVPIDQESVAALQEAAATNPEIAQLLQEAGIEVPAPVRAETPDLTGTAAPETRTQITNRISDDSLREDLNTNVPLREKVSLDEAETKAKQFVNDMSDEGLIGRFAAGVQVSDPQGFFTAMNSIRRLEQLKTPESEVAIRNALDAMTEYASESGRGLRTVQTVFEDMPTTMKHDYLVNKIEKNTGAELPDAERKILLAKIEASDQATAELRTLEEQATSLLESGVLNNKSLAPETLAQVSQLRDGIKTLRRDKEMISNDAYKYYSEQRERGPEGQASRGKKAGDLGRTLMLSSPTGRVFDVGSTFATATDDLMTSSISNLIGKGVNLKKGPGAVSDTLPSAGQLVKGFKEGARDVVDAFKGKGRTEDFMNEASKASRGDINAGGGRARQIIRALVEAPTNLTRGLRENELYRQGMQEAAGLGLKGEAQGAYAELRAAVPSEQQFRQAEQTQMRANMLHDNPVSRGLNKFANSLDQKGNGWMAPLIRNQVAPFTSWLGGNLHRTMTDKNVLWNVGSAVNNFRKGETQAGIDDISKLAGNTAQAYAGGYLLTQAGVITTTDANGDDYGGLYFHIGDRYIPVAAAGTMSVPLILGNAVKQAMDAAGEKGGGLDVTTLINEAGKNVYKNAGVASVFGGENSFQSNIAKLGEDPLGAIGQYGGDLLRQYIPSLTGDVNAILDQTGLNPTHEAAETKVTEENPDTGRQKTDTLATELARTLSRIPGLAQTLPRAEGKLAKDLLDRATHGTHEGEAAAAKREQAESLKDMEKRLKREKVPLKDEAIKAALDDGDYDKAEKGLQYKLAKAEADPDSTDKQKQKIRNELEEAGLQRDGVPVTKEGIKARTEDGDYDSAIRGLEHQVKLAESDKDTPKSKKQDLKDDITRLQVTKSLNLPPEVIEAYEKTSLTEWRAMGNPESEDYDPETYQLLWGYDEALAKKGVSRSTKDGQKQKFAAKGSGKGGRGGSGGGSKKMSTDIATQKFGGAAISPQKALAANFATPESAIPKLQKVPNNDRSKLKKVTVTKGGRTS